jgi:hypothetical protein
MPMTTGFQNIWISFFLSQNLPTLKKVSFAAVECCQQICSSASASHMTRVKILKQIYETRIGEDFFPHICTTYTIGSHSRMFMCCCLTFVLVHMYAILTFVHVCNTVASHSLMCVLHSFTFASNHRIRHVVTKLDHNILRIQVCCFVQKKNSESRDPYLII